RRSTIPDLEHDYTNAVIERDLVDLWQQGRLDLIAADVDQLFFNLFRVVESFQPPLIADAEDDGAASGVSHCYDLAGDLFCVYKADFEFEVSVFAATNQVQEIIPVERPRIAASQFLLEIRALAFRGSPGRPELSAACHCDVLDAGRRILWK